jgi:hypothetical protein
MKTRGSGQWSGWLAIVLAACGPPATVVTITLVDPRRVASPDTSDRLYLVEVRTSPISLLDKVRAGFGADRPDTIPGIRVLFAPVVVHDSVVVGFRAMGAGGSPAGTFTYDLETKKVSRGPLPIWIQDLAEFSRPALSPDAQHIAYVAFTPEGHQQGIVRHWPDGNVVRRGPAGRRPAYRNPGRANWADDYRYTIAYDATVDPYPVQFIVKGDLRVEQGPGDVDTVPWTFDSVPSAAPPVSDWAADTARQAQTQRQWDHWRALLPGIPKQPPSAFADLPAGFRGELEALGCMIPQAVGTRPNNVVRGSFGAKGQLDWAALCSRNRSSSIVVHWGGPAHCPREFDQKSDVQLVSGEIGATQYARRLDVAQYYYPLLDAADNVVTDSIPFEYDAIAEILFAKDSSWWACKNGGWLEIRR